MVLSLHFSPEWKRQPNFLYWPQDVGGGGVQSHSSFRPVITQCRPPENHSWFWNEGAGGLISQRVMQLVSWCFMVWLTRAASLLSPKSLLFFLLPTFSPLTWSPVDTSPPTVTQGPGPVLVLLCAAALQKCGISSHSTFRGMRAAGSLGTCCGPGQFTPLHWNEGECSHHPSFVQSFAK